MHAHFLDGAGEPIGADYLARHGITYEAFATEPAIYQAPLDALKARNGYIQQDIVELAPTTPNLDTLCAKFIDEHTHADDEVRFVLEGEGIFDIRDDADRWMRVQVVAGDLIVVPAGRNHRFLLTEARHIRCVRLFKDAAGWVPNYRAAA
jgi:1,2-dihydroxy-3-keto-5-methylthiopentene dioxygenase